MDEDALGGRQPSDELLAGHAAAKASLMALLERYRRDGYEPRMKEALMQAVNGHLDNFSLDGVYAVPDDLTEVLECFGNPLADEDEETAAPEPALDLTNPEHQQALQERLIESAL